MIKDATDGGIARDQFLAITRKADGTALEQEFLDNFLGLQASGPVTTPRIEPVADPMDIEVR
ncbi:MAG: hypothetical protein M3032_03715 [Verrucomicrobiota bacterium]|nr:hypothetical protein [Verrucomicrobiota bacterium]